MEEKVKVTNAKGLNLAGVIHRPAGEGKFPAVILLHGFCGYKEELHIWELAKDLANEGFVAIRFDASGFGESEGSLDSDYRLSNYLNDIEKIYLYLKSLDYVDASRAAVWGHSMGGMASIIFAAAHPEIKVVCSVSAPDFMRADRREGHPFNGWKERGFFEKVSSRFGKLEIPHAFLEDAQKFNVLDFVPRLRAPLLVVLGGKDIDVLPEETRAIFEKANEPKKLLEVKAMDHYYKNSPELLKQVNKGIIKFLKKYLQNGNLKSY